ncbi:hypothetical protein K1719_007020 [Acacia pycnantha]|nr:hypothetical protein K1719_007020 [Acacia pycnantha]
MRLLFHLNAPWLFGPSSDIICSSSLSLSLSLSLPSLSKRKVQGCSSSKEEYCVVASTDLKRERDQIERSCSVLILSQFRDDHESTCARTLISITHQDSFDKILSKSK